MYRFPLALFLVSFAFFFCGCPGKRDVKGPLDGVHSQKTVDVAAPLPPRSSNEAVDRLERNFARVFFAFDTAQLTPESATLLDENARILVDWPELVVEIQGHADSRGTTGYNLALGTLRAQAVQARLRARGVSPDRLQTVTYGEERPRIDGETPEAWSANRRVEFRVLSGDVDGIAGTVQ